MPAGTAGLDEGEAVGPAEALAAGELDGAAETEAAGDADGAAEGAGDVLGPAEPAEAVGAADALGTAEAAAEPEAAGEPLLGGSVATAVGDGAGTESPIGASVVTSRKPDEPVRSAVAPSP